jgi:hypothetical protein
MACACYEADARAALAADPRWLAEAREASVLVCHCRRLGGKDKKPCHGDVLIRLMREQDAAETAEGGA